MADKVRAWMGTSDVDDAAGAGRSATAAALLGLDGQPPALVVVYASPRYDLPALLAGVRELTGVAPLVGATSAGHFHGGVVTPEDRGVAVLILTAGPYRFGVASVEVGSHPDIGMAGSALARAARNSAGPDLPRHAALLLLSDSFAGDQQLLLGGIHRVLGASVPVVGGSAGDDRRFDSARVFHDDQVLAGSAVGVWIASERPLTVSWGHGWGSIGTPLMVTKVDGLTVCEIDGRPAMEVFLEQVGYEQGPLQAGGYPVKVVTDHPVGLIQADGSHVLRVWTVPTEGQLGCFTPIPLYSPIQILTATPEDVLEVCEPVVKTALDGRDAGVLLAFSCAVRVDVLGERIHDEAARLQAAAGDVPTFGFYTYGEFARSSSVVGYHNASLAAIAL